MDPQKGLGGWMYYLLCGIVLFMAFLIGPGGPVLLSFLCLFTAVLFKMSAKHAKSPLSLASSLKAAVCASALAGVSLLVVSIPGGGDLSTPLGWLLASHWEAGHPTDCTLCPDRLFVIICDAEKGSYLNSLQELASLREDAGNNRQDPGDTENDCLSCIRNKSFSLGKHAGAFGGDYDNDEEDLHFLRAVSFQVVQDSPAKQVIEVHHRDSLRDIADSLFRYETENGEIGALESRVLIRQVIGVYMELAIVASVMLLCIGLKALWRFWAGGRGKEGGEPSVRSEGVFVVRQ